jgi:5-methylcytosine-specific restriction endonuclease McrA
VCEHLKEVDRQATSPRSRYLDACRAHNRGELDEDELRARTAELGFVNVIDAFHVVNAAPTPMRFFVDERANGGGIRLTEDLLRLAAEARSTVLANEVEARWRLVETAWELNLPTHLISVSYEPDGEIFVVEDARIRRRSVTACRPALNGYQRGSCFYCRGPLSTEGEAIDADVDHFLPWSLGQFGFLANLDGVWNLVLACRECNRGERGKGSRLPAPHFLERLRARNEYLIASHHPLRETLMRQTGATERARTRFLRRAYDEARPYLVHTWEPDA